MRLELQCEASGELAHTVEYQDSKLGTANMGIFGCFLRCTETLADAIHG